MKKILLLASLATMTSVFAEVIDLTPEEIQQVKGGKDIVKSEEVRGAPLPRVRIYTFVKAPVEVIEFVFRDYENSHKYVPGVIKATIVSQPHPDTYIVQTISKVPVVGTSKSTVKNVFHKKGHAIVVDWTLVESDQAAESKGQLCAEPTEGGSIMRYTNFLKPKITLGASLLRSSALKEVEKNVAALKAESERKAKEMNSE